MSKTFDVHGGVGVEADCGCKAVKIADFEQVIYCQAHLNDNTKGVIANAKELLTIRRTLLAEAEAAQLHWQRTWLHRAVLKEPHA